MEAEASYLPFPRVIFSFLPLSSSTSGPREAA
jgi:hypothetical protein